MDWVKFDYPHSVGLSEAAAAVATAAQAICSRCRLEMTRKRNRADLSGKVMRGSITAHKDRISVSMVLVGQVTPTRASVEAEIRGALDRQFASSNGG